jgi:hypothetical protein
MNTMETYQGFFSFLSLIQSRSIAYDDHTLGITILMSLTFFMNMVSEMMPPTSDTPIIGRFTIHCKENPIYACLFWE